MPTFFAPQLTIPNGVTDISFYSKAFGAVEIQRYSNEDGSVHVSELSIDGAIFHLHEETSNFDVVSPQTCRATTTIIGLFVPDVDAVMEKALAAGATLIHPATSYDYGYRQGDIKDPFGHHWMIEKKI
ncbi:MAG: VOC family protein [Ferruginibacter sp.]